MEILCSYGNGSLGGFDRAFFNFVGRMFFVIKRGKVEKLI